MTTEHPRLAKLERIWSPPIGGPVCRSWGGTVLADAAGRRSQPDAGPDCGRRVPARQTLLIVGVDLAGI